MQHLGEVIIPEMEIDGLNFPKKNARNRKDGNKK